MNEIVEEIWTEERLRRLPIEARERILSTIAKYGDNKWWTAKDVKVMAAWQLFECCLMVPFSEFHKGLELWLDRPIYTHEFGLNLAGLRMELRNAMQKAKKSGNYKLTNEARAKKGIESIETLVTFYENNKQVIGV